jgi:hypothetical protein
MVKKITSALANVMRNIPESPNLHLCTKYSLCDVHTKSSVYYRIDIDVMSQTTKQVVYWLSGPAERTTSGDWLAKAAKSGSSDTFIARYKRRLIVPSRLSRSLLPVWTAGIRYPDVNPGLGRHNDRPNE